MPESSGGSRRDLGMPSSSPDFRSKDWSPRRRRRTMEAKERVPRWGGDRAQWAARRWEPDGSVLVRSSTAPRGPYGISQSVKTCWNEPTMSFGVCKKTTCPSSVIVLFFESSFQLIRTGLPTTRGSFSGISVCTCHAICVVNLSITLQAAKPQRRTRRILQRDVAVNKFLQHDLTVEVAVELYV